MRKTLTEKVRVTSESFLSSCTELWRSEETANKTGGVIDIDRVDTSDRLRHERKNPVANNILLSFDRSNVSESDR
jgi:hypothetical protein